MHLGASWHPKKAGRRGASFSLACCLASGPRLQCRAGWAYGCAWHRGRVDLRGKRACVTPRWLTKETVKTKVITVVMQGEAVQVHAVHSCQDIVCTHGRVWLFTVFRSEYIIIFVSLSTEFSTDVLNLLKEESATAQQQVGIIMRRNNARWHKKGKPIS